MLWCPDNWTYLKVVQALRTLKIELEIHGLTKQFTDWTVVNLLAHSTDSSGPNADNAFTSVRVPARAYSLKWIRLHSITDCFNAARVHLISIHCLPSQAPMQVVNVCICLQWMSWRNCICPLVHDKPPNGTYLCRSIFAAFCWSYRLEQRVEVGRWSHACLSYL